MEIFCVNEDGTLYVSSDIDDWDAIHARGVTVIVDMDGEIDHHVPTQPDHFLYVYYPIHDEDLPNLGKLHAIAQLVATLTRFERVLVHCRAGYNRSCLVAGLALTYLGRSGAEALGDLRAARPAALWNESFARYLGSLAARSVPATMLGSGGGGRR
jgi:protein-tyrosine phosphatase